MPAFAGRITRDELATPHRVSPVTRSNPTSTRRRKTHRRRAVPIARLLCERPFLS